MSQGSKGSSKFMIVIWVIAMLFIGLKALNAPSNESAHEDTMIDSATLERIKPIGEVRIDNSASVASSSTIEQSERSGEEIYKPNVKVVIALVLWVHLSMPLLKIGLLELNLALTNLLYLL